MCRLILLSHCAYHCSTHNQIINNTAVRVIKHVQAPCNAVQAGDSAAGTAWPPVSPQRDVLPPVAPPQLLSQLRNASLSPGVPDAGPVSYSSQPPPSPPSQREGGSAESNMMQSSEDDRQAQRSSSSMRRIRSAADVTSAGVRHHQCSDVHTAAFGRNGGAAEPCRSSESFSSRSRRSRDAGRTHGHRSPPYHAVHRGRRSAAYLRSIADLSADPLSRTKRRSIATGDPLSSALFAQAPLHRRNDGASGSGQGSGIASPVDQSVGTASTGALGALAHWSGNSATASPCFTGQQWVCALDFHPQGGLLLSARVKKVIEVYNAWREPGGEPCAEPVAVLRHETASKIATAEWCPWHASIAACGDYDGVLNRIDVATDATVVEIDEHGGHRLRCFAHNAAMRGMAASCGEDGGIRLWGGQDCSQRAGRLAGVPAVLAGWNAQTSGALRLGHSAAIVNGLAWREGSMHELAAGDAAGNIAVWDVRRHDAPLSWWPGHKRPCSHVVECSAAGIVSAAIDSTLRVWPTGSPQPVAASAHSMHCPAAAPVPTIESTLDGERRPLCELGGHTNSSHFVGLSAHASGLVATGCEHGVVHVFDASDGVNAGRHKVVMHMAIDACVSSVAWERCTDVASGSQPLLAAGTSDGTLQVLQLHSHDGKEA